MQLRFVGNDLGIQRIVALLPLPRLQLADIIVIARRIVRRHWCCGLRENAPGVRDTSEWMCNPNLSTRLLPLLGKADMSRALQRGMRCHPLIASALQCGEHA